MTAQPFTVAAVRAGKRTQRLGRRPAVEPGPVLVAWEAAVDRDDAREAAGMLPLLPTLCKPAANRQQMEVPNGS
jgi:hypothetical protein